MRVNWTERLEAKWGGGRGGLAHKLTKHPHHHPPPPPPAEAEAAEGGEEEDRASMQHITTLKGPCPELLHKKVEGRRRGEGLEAAEGEPEPPEAGGAVEVRRWRVGGGRGCGQREDQTPRPRFWRMSHWPIIPLFFFFPLRPVLNTWEWSSKKKKNRNNTSHKTFKIRRTTSIQLEQTQTWMNSTVTSCFARVAENLQAWSRF